ncbi:response regulator transcription factor [Anaerocolumna sp. AGMB13020]|uniref:response regulator transcription factor n=1 Tax=Anaerocolumna sp. AGMB13020 TaxID=3081750 RepID=UPI002952E518|nr:response regulator transcription factor [Anaerocolumna sp. AGMB13020]WOO36079.1 response regulator transcription factor [Anaerocolumna sp. AGMB13020]
MTKILIVEDDRHINELIKRNLKLVGYDCDQAYDGKNALEIFRKDKYDLILLDVMLPNSSGFELIPEIKDTPVIFVTAKGELKDKLQGLSLGAEDYLVKPFEMLELIARVGVVLKRYKKAEETFQLGDAMVYLDKRSVYVRGREMDITPREYSLLETLIINKNIALSREKLLDIAWGYDYEGETKTVDVHIQKLRKKLGWESYIKTIVKLGYRLEC